MKVIALTDVHGAYGVLAAILTREAPFDAVVIGGDLTTRGTPAEAEEAILSIMAHGCPVLAVAGNMDSPAVEAAMGKTAHLLDGRGFLLDTIGFFGVSAAPPTPLNTPYEIPEEEILRRAEAGWNQVQGATRRIFVPHAPPFNTRLDSLRNGQHVGSRSVRRFIEERRPDAVVCGHIHEARGLDTLGTTNMMNCGPAHQGSYGVVTIGETITLECRG